MKKRFRKLLSFAMAAAMTVTLLPATASAAPDAAEGEANDNLLRIGMMSLPQTGRQKLLRSATATWAAWCTAAWLQTRST